MTDSLKPKFQFRWYHIYFLVAALDMSIILTSLVMQHTTLSAFKKIVSTSNTIAIKQERVAFLRSALLRLVTPANQVLYSQDVVLETKNFENERNSIENFIDAARKDGLAIDGFLKEINSISDYSRRVFASLNEAKANPALQSQKEHEAASFMAAMIKHQSASMESLAEIDRALIRQNIELFVKQQKILQNRQNGEWTLVVFVILAVFGIIYFGRRIHFAFEQHIREQRELNRQLEIEKTRALEAARAKGEFLANMSHEIRTPMNAIIGFSHILESTELNEIQREYLKSIETSGELLLGIINDILDLSKLDSGKVKLESIDFNLEHLVNDVFKMVAERVREKQIDSFIEIQPDVIRALKGDPTRLRQIIINLLSNAIKFTESGSISVRVRQLSLAGENICIEIAVEDTGAGIPKDKHDLIFESFSQADTSTTRKFGGTGLGLTICRKLVNAMGGKIWVESEDGKGSKFIFTAMFLKGNDVLESDILPVNREKLKGKKILIVDDSRHSLQILKNYCEELGIQVLASVTSAKAGLQILDALAKERKFPDVILSDVMMPELSGYEFATKVKSNEHYSAIKMIAITSDIRLGASQEAQTKGFDGFLPKPVIKDQLLKILVTVLGDHRDKKDIVTRHLAEEVVYKDISVLIVEDNVLNLKLALALLKKLGCKTEHVVNGQEAVDIIRQNHQKYDLCLMDMQMPVMGGVEAAQIIRRDITKDLPIIALTAAVLEEDQMKARQAGMNDFLAKPINIHRLKEMLFKYGKK